MPIATTFTVPAAAFALEQTFEKQPSLSVEIEQVATHSREWVMPFVWTTSDTPQTVHTTLEADPSVESVEPLSLEGRVGYFNIHWVERVQALVDQIINKHGILQQATATTGVWDLRLQFVDHDALEEFQTFVRTHEYGFELQRLTETVGPNERGYDLTAAQRETLLLALESGYFAVPRETQLEALAAELGISANATSQRLRRATANLTRQTLAVPPNNDKNRVHGP